MISPFTRESQSASECHPHHTRTPPRQGHPQTSQAKADELHSFKITQHLPRRNPDPFVSTTLNGNHSSLTCLRKDSLHISLKITALIQSRRFLVQFRLPLSLTRILHFTKLNFAVEVFAADRSSLPSSVCPTDSKFELPIPLPFCFRLYYYYYSGF